MQRSLHEAIEKFSTHSHTHPPNKHKHTHPHTHSQVQLFRLPTDSEPFTKDKVLVIYLKQNSIRWKKSSIHAWMTIFWRLQAYNFCPWQTEDWCHGTCPILLLNPLLVFWASQEGIPKTQRYPKHCDSLSCQSSPWLSLVSKLRHCSAPSLTYCILSKH